MKKLVKYIEDILIISGLIITITATFMWSKIGGLYALGAALFGLGVFFIRYPYRKG